jgi:hypothetical protein
MTPKADKKIDFEGIEFTIPSDAAKLPVKAVEAWEEDRLVTFVKALLGPEAWAKFTARDPDMEEFGRLANAIGESYGFESAGESSASGDSSKNTSTPSRPPSAPPMPSNSPVSSSAP